MAVAYRSTSTLVSAGASSLAVAAPAGLANDDIMIAIAKGVTGSTVTSVPSGWTLIRTITSASLYWKRASSESGTYTWGFSSSIACRASISAYTGVITSGTPYDAENGQENASSNSITAPSCSPVQSNGYLVFVASLNNSAADRTVTPPGSMVEDYDSGLRMLQTFAHEQLSASGATGTRVGTIDAAAANINFGYLVVLTPASVTAVLTGTIRA